MDAFDPNRQRQAFGTAICFQMRAPTSGVEADVRLRTAAGRWIALSGAIVARAVLAIVLIPQFGMWTAPGALPHHHHG